MPKSNSVIIIIILGLFLIFFISSPSVSKDFSLKDSYNFYKDYYLSKDGRVIDPGRNYGTTSEGQSYMLLKSLLMNDKDTFNLVYDWTKNNLQRKDFLFSWLWGCSDKTCNLVLDNNTASDADIDIAYALVLAHEKWNDKKYLYEALPIINAVWENEVIKNSDFLILMPGAKQAKSDKIEINPSYFSPAAFRKFQQYDKNHDWQGLAASSYKLAEMAMNAAPSGLPPDWFILKDGKVVLEKGRSDFSYDAVRVFPRFYIDYKLNKDERALKILDKTKFFIEKWEKEEDFHTNFKPDGELKNHDKFLGTIAVMLPIINMYNEKIANQIYNKELYPYFKTKGYWGAKNEYYAQNLVWFGFYLLELKK